MIRISALSSVRFKPITSNHDRILLLCRVLEDLRPAIGKGIDAVDEHFRRVPLLQRTLLEAPPPVQQKPAAAAPLNLLNTLNNSDPMTAMLLRAAPLLASANREDDSTRLLAALRPLLGEARQKKLDEASKSLKLLHLLPLLKESGVLQNIL